jgi:hypothetical protein
MASTVGERFRIDVVPNVASAVSDVVATTGLSDRTRGGYFCFAEWAIAFVPIGVVLIGQLADDTARISHFEASIEKAQRLVTIYAGELHRPDCPPHFVSSWVMRDPIRGRLGGGIMVRGYYMAFSGLDELVDEAVMLVAARRLGLLTERAAKAIAELSNNHIFLDSDWSFTAP